MIDVSDLESELIAQDHLPLIGDPCPACSAPREGTSKFCIACGAPLETPEAPPAARGKTGIGHLALPAHTFQCQNCGSEVATSADQRTYQCPFCDSAFVTEIPFERSGRQRPEFVIGFAVTAEQAKQKFYDWLGKNAWFRPGDLAKKAVSDKQKGVYLPFWHFSMHASSRWSASIGQYWYRQETYTTKDANGKTVRHTRTVRETEWYPLNGEHGRYYYGFLVPATRGISSVEARAIQPYRLTALARYRPYFLAGWMAEEYSVDMDDAIEETKSEFRQRQEHEVRRFLPGDTNSNLSVHTDFDVNGSDLILLPVHVLSYRYHDRVFRFLVNGQTGKIVGEKPWSKRRVAALVVAIMLVIVVAATVVYLVSENASG